MIVDPKILIQWLLLGFTLFIAFGLIYRNCWLFSHTKQNTKNISRFLTFRYITAVLIIALLSITAYTSLTFVIISQDSYSSIINISGRQRMLSQRIALYATRLTLANQGQDGEIRATLADLIELMKTSHNGLTKGDATIGLTSSMSDTVREIYFEKPIQLNARVLEYLSLATNILNTPNGQHHNDPIMLQALLDKSPYLLSNLDKIVSQYETEAKEVSNFLELLELIVLVATLFTLLVEVLLIFRPMVKFVVALHNNIDEKETLLLTFVKHTPAAVAMFDRNINYIAASDRWFTDYGIQDQNIIGKNHYKIFPEIPKHHPKWLAIHQRVIEGEIIKQDEEAFTRKDGTIDWLRYELHPWKQAEGNIGGLIMFTENITARKQMETMKDEFISTVNQELRAPLTSLKLSLGLLKTTASDKLDKDNQRILQLAYDNCNRLYHLVDDILDLERVTAGKINYEIESVELCHLVGNILEHYKSYANSNHVTFKLNLEIDEIYCDIDISRFNQALVNLLSNASKFSPQDDVVTITIKMHDDKHIFLAVADNGRGISNEFKQKIFSKFAQEYRSTSSSKGGTGLGLNITKSIIEAFKGKVGFHSELGKGATFYFILPISTQSINQQEEI